MVRVRGLTATTRSRVKSSPKPKYPFPSKCLFTSASCCRRHRALCAKAPLSEIDAFVWGAKTEKKVTERFWINVKESHIEIVSPPTCFSVCCLGEMLRAPRNKLTPSSLPKAVRNWLRQAILLKLQHHSRCETRRYNRNYLRTFSYCIIWFAMSSHWLYHCNTTQHSLFSCYRSSRNI